MPPRSRFPVLDNEDTVIGAAVTSAADGIDEDTIIGLNEDTVIRPAEHTVVTTDVTVASRRRAAGADEKTRLSRGRSLPVEDKTVRRDRAPGTARPGVPGRLSGGRVAEVPGENVQRYGVRESAAPSAEVLRTVIEAPVSELRQSRDIHQVEMETRRGRRRGSAFVLVAVPVVTLLTAAIIGAIILLLSL
jgi:hypothetical protein